MKLQRIVINWKLGDHKLAHSKSSTQVFINDSLYNNTETIGYYSIKVIDTVKNYTILYSSEPQSIEINTKSSVAKLDSGIKFFTDIIKKVEKETQSFKYELLIDKSTGLAFKVKNGDSFLKAVEQACATIIQESGERMKKPSKQIDSIKQKINTYFKDAQVKVLETMLNQFNYIMQPYSYEFPYNTTISQKTMVHDVNTLGTLGDVEIPAILTISSKKVNNILTIKTITDYDKAFMLAQIKKKYKNTSHLTTSDIFLSEKTEATFLTKSGWIVSHKSNVIFDMKEVKVINETVVSFQ